MTDRPLIFSAASIRALLAGSKTQSRRVLKPQPPCDEYGEPVGGAFYGPNWYTSIVVDRWSEEQPGPEVYGISGDGWGVKIPYVLGDRLWVRETFSTDGQAERECIYLATIGTDSDYSAEEISEIRWRSPIHMPRWASRLTLTVTDVRVQRVQDISEEDARAEGVGTRDAFACAWDAIHGHGAWARNDWVAALTFTVREGNINHD